MTHTMTKTLTAERNARAEKIASLNDKVRALFDPDTASIPSAPFQLVITQGIGAL